MVSLQYEEHPEDSLVAQARLFLESIMTTWVVIAKNVSPFIQPTSGTMDVVYSMFSSRSVCVLQLRYTLMLFCIQRALPAEFFKVLANALSTKTIVASHASLRDALLHDTLSRAPDNEAESYQLVLDNINNFIELVHHSNYSGQLLQCEWVAD